jgi:Ras-related protein Rab-11A
MSFYRRGVCPLLLSYPLYRYYRGALGALLMYDVTKLSSFSNLKTCVEELREHASPHIAVILIGNKTDPSLPSTPDSPTSSLSFAIRTRNRVAEIVRRLPLGAYLSCSVENGMIYMETSAFSASNVEYAFELVLTQIYHMETMKMSKYTKPSSSSSG